METNNFVFGSRAKPCVASDVRSDDVESIAPPYFLDASRAL